jgi:hypothetical protein
MTSEFSTDKFNNLILKYDILNGIYERDVCYDGTGGLLKEDIEYIRERLNSKKVQQS